MSDHSFVDDYEFGASFYRALSTLRGGQDISGLCAAEPALTERVGEAMRPVLRDIAAFWANVEIPQHLLDAVREQDA